MDKLTIENIPQMFDYVGILFAEKRDELCAMDAVMGDGDLGLTMSKGYGALPAFLRDLTGEDDAQGCYEDAEHRTLYHGNSDVFGHHGGWQGIQGQDRACPF